MNKDWFKQRIGEIVEIKRRDSVFSERISIERVVRSEVFTGIDWIDISQIEWAKDWQPVTKDTK